MSTGGWLFVAIVLTPAAIVTFAILGKAIENLIKRRMF